MPISRFSLPPLSSGAFFSFLRGPSSAHFSFLAVAPLEVPFSRFNRGTRSANLSFLEKSRFFLSANFSFFRIDLLNEYYTSPICHHIAHMIFLQIQSPQNTESDHLSIWVSHHTGKLLKKATPPSERCLFLVFQILPLPTGVLFSFLVGRFWRRCIFLVFQVGSPRSKCLLLVFSLARPLLQVPISRFWKPPIWYRSANLSF